MPKLSAFIMLSMLLGLVFLIHGVGTSLLETFETHDVCVDIIGAESQTGWLFRLREWGYDAAVGKNCRFVVGKNLVFLDGEKTNVSEFEYRNKTLSLEIQATDKCDIGGEPILKSGNKNLLVKKDQKYYSCVDLGREMFSSKTVFKPVVEEILDSELFVRSYAFENLNPVIVRMEIEPDSEWKMSLNYSDYSEIFYWDRYNTTYFVVPKLLEDYPWLKNMLRGKNLAFHGYWHEDLTNYSEQQILSVLENMTIVKKELGLKVDGFGAPLISGSQELALGLDKFDYRFDSSVDTAKEKKDPYLQYPFGVTYGTDQKPRVVEFPTTYPNDYDLFVVFNDSLKEARKDLINSFKKNYENNEYFTIHLHNWVIIDKLDFVDQLVSEILTYPGTYVENYYIYERFAHCIQNRPAYSLEGKTLTIHELNGCNALINRQVKGASKIIIKNDKNYSLITKPGTYYLEKVVESNIDVELDYSEKQVRLYNNKTLTPRIVLLDGSEIRNLPKTKEAYYPSLGVGEAEKRGLTTVS